MSPARQEDRGIPGDASGFCLSVSEQWSCFGVYGTFGPRDAATLAPITRQNSVVRGLYRVVRNPMYVAVFWILLGQSLFFKSLWLFYYAIAAGIVIHLFVMFYEEPALRRKFGAEYDAYCRRVYRWLPRFFGAPTVSEMP